jgi:hypothetical protein
VPHLHLLSLSFATDADALFCIASSHRSLFLRLSDLDPREGAVAHDDKSILIIQIHQQCDGLCFSGTQVLSREKDKIRKGMITPIVF